MAETILVLKTDVEPLKGYREGVPRLLEIFRARKIKVSFFFSFGPDNSGRAIRRIFRKGFLKKMLRTKAPSTYGFRTLLYGTLLPAPLIVQPEPGVFIRAVEEGHDCGIHCWDHVKWQDRLPRLTPEQIREDFRKSMELFELYASQKAKSCAAPGWQVTPESLAVQDELGFDYCSDIRGSGYAFRPRMGGRTFKTLQIPTTLPTLDEVYGREDIPGDGIVDYYLDQLQPGLNVHTIHAEMEAGPEPHPRAAPRPVRGTGSVLPHPQRRRLRDLRPESHHPRVRCGPRRAPRQVGNGGRPEMRP